ncbi:hypothetical protein P6P90_09225 [Ectobacillus antri]|jgi:iron uptake system EfeUOB component EfeO/EfeM|uniref:Uncharacterized protein n=1 Tax=Ectobacillus antri TaxID=2486280 RepID=A0ABT6H4H6_9BACI|nr:hypothetical protein [Ectobacillus antri]MDG4657051.1 hypothetical protein [Ectobacillus antri]MDG5754153.1 hypothetical protein [Ectobacillus antri]
MYKYILSLITAVCLLSGCHTQEDKQAAPNAVETSATDRAAIVEGIQSVLTELQSFTKYLQTAADQEKIKSFGKNLAEKWDSFEDEVEEQYPEQYKKIEDNLYPLIGETGKAELDVDKIKSLLQQVQQDLNMFLTELQ